MKYTQANGFSLRVNPELKKQIEEAAKIDGVTQSDFIRNAVICYLLKPLTYSNQRSDSSYTDSKNTV